MEANATPMRVIKCIPRVLRQWWSKAVTVTLHDWWSASTTKQALKALERWVKLKATIIRPIRGAKRGKPNEPLRSGKKTCKDG